MRWAPSAFRAGELRPLRQADLFPFSVSWKVGPWTPCSVSCGGGFQSRPVYCISSDGAGGQEAAEEIQCAGLPGKPPATQACNLQRCAAWSVEPWGEVRPLPRTRSYVLGLGSSRPGLKGLSSVWKEAYLGPERRRDLAGHLGRCSQSWDETQIGDSGPGFSCL